MLAKPAEKAALLEKLTGTEVYSKVSEQIFRMTQEADKQVELLETQRSTMLQDQLDEHLLAEQQERQRLLQSKRQNAQQTVQRIEQQIDWIDRLTSPHSWLPIVKQPLMLPLRHVSKHVVMS